MFILKLSPEVSVFYVRVLFSKVEKRELCRGDLGSGCAGEEQP